VGLFQPFGILAPALLSLTNIGNLQRQCQITTMGSVNASTSTGG
jgi:hypothetical protein